MSGKVTESQINSTTFQADEFRKAVNYTNPKNKGYVRFEPNGQGGVKIAKVNNKVDLFINWRTNVDAEKNKAMRAKFVDAISLNLKWADQTKVRDIAESIKLVAKGAHKGDIRTDALSRKELQAAFKDYDKLMNPAAVRGEVTPRRRPWGSHTPPPSLGKSHPAARRICPAGAESTREARRPARGGKPSAAFSLKLAWRQTAPLPEHRFATRYRSGDMRSVWGNLRCPRLALAALRVDSLPRSEWTPCRQSAALRRKSVGTSAAPPALRASAARGDIRMESAPRPVRQSAALRGKAVGTSAAHIRRAAVRGLGTFTWGFLRHSPASVLARGKAVESSRLVSCRVTCRPTWLRGGNEYGTI